MTADFDPFAGAKAPKGPKLKFKVTEEKIKGDSEQNRQVKSVGEQLNPEGFEYLGSICVHIYKGKFNRNIICKTQNLIGDATAIEANWALQQASIAVAESFGWKRPATRQDVLRKEE